MKDPVRAVDDAYGPVDDLRRLRLQLDLEGWNPECVVRQIVLLGAHRRQVPPCPTVLVDCVENLEEEGRWDRAGEWEVVVLWVLMNCPCWISSSSFRHAPMMRNRMGRATAVFETRIEIEVFERPEAIEMARKDWNHSMARLGY